jgi:hypothetical protein
MTRGYNAKSPISKPTISSLKKQDKISIQKNEIIIVHPNELKISKAVK